MVRVDTTQNCMNNIFLLFDVFRLNSEIYLHQRLVVCSPARPHPEEVLGRGRHATHKHVKQDTNTEVQKSARDLKPLYNQRHVKVLV